MKEKHAFCISFFASLALIAVVAFLGPEEASLGKNVRLVYLHGAWVMTAEGLFYLAALSGLGALLTKKKFFYIRSEALGKSGIFYWISYLPLSLLAMQANWNGFFLAEPRFRYALTFAVFGLFLQVGLWMMELDWLLALANIFFLIALRFSFSRVENIMHPPPSPIFSSGNRTIIGFFLVLNFLVWISAYFLTRYFSEKSKYASR